jgi:hypothetical protein
LQGTLLHVEPNLIWMCLELVYLVSEWEGLSCGIQL